MRMMDTCSERGTFGACDSGGQEAIEQQHGQQPGQVEVVEHLVPDGLLQEGLVHLVQLRHGDSHYNAGRQYSVTHITGKFSPLSQLGFPGTWGMSADCPSTSCSKYCVCKGGNSNQGLLSDT